jgi:hypothetical protein
MTDKELALRMLATTHITNPLYKLDMLEHWGERCDEFEQDCSACQAWAHFDKTGEVME